MTALFFYGTLRHPDLLSVVLGRSAATMPAILPGHEVFRVGTETWPAIVAGGGSATGVLLTEATDADVARLDFYEGAYGYVLRPVSVLADRGTVTALVYFPTGDQPAPGAPWRLDDWVRDHGAATVAAAAEAMGHAGRLSPQAVRDRYGQMLVRGASRVRAGAEPAPATVRSDRTADEIDVSATRRPYAEYFAVIEQDVTFPTFDGGRSARVTRAAFVQGDAVTVLPYDPARDRTLLVEQFRYGPFARGDPRPWSLEPIAGRIDPGETPEAAIRREAREEARLDLGALHEVGRYYPSPGAVTEWLVSYVGIADLPDGIAGVAGEASEAEDIRGHLVPFDRVMEMIATGEAANGPLILSAYWIALHRERLRVGA